MADKLLELIDNPSNDYRPVPFWSWNEKLDPKMLAWQIEQMNKAGIGGYFMHARGGLETEYLSDEWFDCIKTGLEEGKRLGMNAYVYDEEGWPSGFAGGRVTQKGNFYHAQGLAVRDIEGLQGAADGKNVLGVYGYTPETDSFEKVTSESKKYSRLVEVTSVSSPHYIDVLKKEVVADFIKETHQQYAKRFPGELGKSLKGFFTDEPRLSVGNVPWSDILEEEFYNSYGYNVTDNLAALFYKCSGYEKIRCDFWSLVNRLFVHSFMEQIHSWCKENGCLLTGHVMMEESIYSQMTGTAGSMPFYEYMDIPGVDWLRRTKGDVRMTKQVGSVAQQLGKKFVLSESYALCGWDVSFEELRWIAAWQYVNGVNLMCQHLQGYSLRGLRKRDYPPSLFYQQSWWEKYKLFNDYLARLGAILSNGKAIVDTLVIHPMASGFLTYDGFNNDEMKALDNVFSSICEELSALHIDYHLGDESIMEAHASVKENKIIIGNASYQTVILPSMKTLNKNTLDMLLKLAENGGKIICIGEFPTLCNGVYEPRLGLLKTSALCIDSIKNAALYEAVTAQDKLHISIAQNGRQIKEIHSRQLEAEFGRIIFMINTDKSKSFQAEVSLDGCYSIEKVNLETVSTELVNSKTAKGKTGASLTVEPMEAIVLRLTKTAEKAMAENESSIEKIICISKENWHIESMGPNAITLDKCSYRINKSGWQEEIPVIQLMKKLLDKQENCAIEMKFTVNIEAELSKIGEVNLILEQPEKFTIEINGKPIQIKKNGFYKDISFEKINITELLSQGENCILLKTEFYQSKKVYETLYGENVYETELNKLTYDMELESIYLIGNFGVYSQSEFTVGEKNSIRTKGPFVIRNMPTELVAGDFTQQGLLFFSDKLKLSKKLSISKAEGVKQILKFVRPRATMFDLYINGEFVKNFVWEPFCCDATDYLKDGENTVTIELYATNRNLLGPHHHSDGESYSVGPSSFSGEFSWVERPTEAVAITDEMRKKIYRCDDYSFVTFYI